MPLQKRIVRLPRLAFMSCSVLLLSLTPFSNAVAIEKFDSEIKAVTVFPDSAKVTRQTEINLTSGKNEISLSQLPIQLRPATLRLKFIDSTANNVDSDPLADITINSIDLEQHHQSESSQPAQQSLLDQIEQLTREMTHKQHNIERYNQQITLINSMADNKADSATSYQQLPMAQWTEAWALIDENVEKYQRKIENETRETAEIEKQVSVLRRELNDLGNGQTSSYKLNFTAFSKTAKTATLQVEYQINNAFWVPEYDLSLAPKTGDVHVNTSATIRQQTGEDWEHVEMTVSTRRPNANIQLPDLRTWSLDFSQPPMPVSYNKNGFSASKHKEYSEELIETDLQDSPIADAMAARAPFSELVSTDFVTEYRLSQAVSLKSGGSQKKMAISEQTLASNVTLNSAPRFDTRALIIANIDYKGDAPLLAGQANLYLDNQFIGNQRLPMIQSGEHVKLSFGEDDLVSIRFRSDPDKKSQDGIFSKSRTVERHYLVSIRNQHDSPQNIVITEQFPIAKNEKIITKRTGVKPSRNDIDDKKGIVAWDIKAGANEEATLRYGYQISYPANLHINELE